MADTVNRDWRKTKPSHHTREVISEHLPSDIRQALATLIERVIALEALTVQQAETINAQNLKLVNVEKEAADIRAVMNAVGQEALRKLGKVA